MNADLLKRELETRGMRLSVDRGKLAVDFPKGVLDEATRRLIQDHKKALLEALHADTLRLDAQFLRFAPTQLLGVILGAKASPDNEAEVAAWAAEREAVLTLWKARINAAGSVELQPYTP